MSRNQRPRIVCLKLPQQVEQGTFLGKRTGIGGSSRFIESPLVTDADALVIPAGGMRADLMSRTADMHFPVAGDVEMIAYIGKATLQMTAS